MHSSELLAKFQDLRNETSPTSVDLAGLKASDKLTRYLDEALRSVVNEAEAGGKKKTFTLIAHGSNARFEQTRFSDIDLMILVDKDSTEFATKILYPLWDANFKVGYSVREIGDLESQSLGSIETATSLVDARFIAGSEELWQLFTKERSRIMRVHGLDFITELAGRYEIQRDDEPWQTLAIDIKSGRGGLRTLSSINWIHSIQNYVNPDFQIEDEHLAILGNAREVLLATRNALHAQHRSSSRTVNLLHPDIALRVGDWLQIDIVQWQQHLFSAMRDVDSCLSNLVGVKSAVTELDSNDEFSAQQEPDLDVFLKGIDRMKRRMDRGDLEPLPTDDHLAELLPEWEPLRARPHRVSFHTHPIDVHNARAVLEAHRIIENGDEFDQSLQLIYEKLENTYEFLIAVLLHDIGKGRGSTHSPLGAELAEGICDRFKISATARDRIVRAVRYHLLLPETATRRDISDESVVADVANQLVDLPTLRLVYLVTAADARATGGQAWNQWRSQLISTLYKRVEAYFGIDGSSQFVERLRQVKTYLADFYDSDTIESHIDLVDESYLFGTRYELIAQHIAQINDLFDSKEQVSLKYESLGDVYEFSIISRDRTGLLRDITGLLAGFNMSVLSGVAHTRDDGLAIQVWHVSDALGYEIDHTRWDRLFHEFPRDAEMISNIEQRVDEVLSRYHNTYFDDLPATIDFDNVSSEQYTILEVSVRDRPTLLYQITKTLSDLELNIHLAKVDTIGNQVVDIFYLSKFEGKLHDDLDLAPVREAVYRAVQL
jgi:UTP:GlnB (protein PII) uridylyltransferase